MNAPQSDEDFIAAANDLLDIVSVARTRADRLEKRSLLPKDDPDATTDASEVIDYDASGKRIKSK
jgi:hypothetical protein